jgi:rfaE bifunctional protein nucleotidyltransferase chain/domain
MDDNFFQFFEQLNTGQDEPIIFTNGVFDLLHIGHIKFLQACKALGGHVVVGLNSDSSVKRLKGEHRPINNEFERKHMLLALDCVDEVVTFIEDNPLEIITLMQPDIYVKSSEYQNADLPEFRAVKEYGGRIAIVTPDKDLEKVKTSNKIDTIFKRELERRLK